MNREEREHLYGQAIVDFINAETTDGACLGLISYIKKIHGFSAGFRKKVLNGFPLLNVYTSLAKPERKLFDYFHKEKELLNQVGGTIAYIMAEFKSYDPEKKTLTYRKAPPIAPMSNNNVDASELVEESIRDLEEKLFKEFALLGDIYPEYKDWKFREAHELVKVGKGILDLKRAIPKSRYSEINELSKDYSKILSEHKKIQEHQRILEKILSSMVEGKSPFKTKLFKRFLREYNNCCKVEIRLAPGGYLYDEMIFPNEDNFIRLNVNEQFEDDSWFEPYRIATIFYIIEFVKSLRENAWKNVKRCPYCKQLFLAKNARRQKCYSKNCRKID